MIFSSVSPGDDPPETPRHGGFPPPISPRRGDDPRRPPAAFFAAADHGDFDALVAILDPDVVLRSDGGTARPDASVLLHGAAAVAARTLTIAQPSEPKRAVLVNGAAGVIVTAAGQPVAVIGFTISRGKITEIDAIIDPDRLRRLDLALLDH